MFRKKYKSQRLVANLPVALCFLSIGIFIIFERQVFAAPASATTSESILTQQVDFSENKPNTFKYQYSVHNYSVPDVFLVDKDGVRILLNSVLNVDKLVLLNFIFTTCPSICPILSATFSQVQRKLESESLLMISISIDPEHDTPERLQNYAAKFKAGPSWKFFTGRLEDIISVQQSFDSYRGDKMSHQQLIFLRSPGNREWRRIKGIITATDLIEEIKTLSKNQNTIE